MSKEFRAEVYREGFITALCGIEPTERFINTSFKMNYINGRKDGREALQTPAGLKLRNKIDHICKAEVFQTSHEGE